MSKIKKIDVSKQVMNNIKSNGIKMHSARYFQLIKWLKISLLALMSVILVTAISSVVYAFKNDTFSAYLDFASGKLLFVKSLPWPGIIVSALVGAGILYGLNHMRKSYDKNFSMQVIGATLSLLLIPAVVIGLSANSANTPKILSSLAYFSSNDPVELELTIKGIQDGYLYAVDNDGNKKIIKNVDSRLFSEGDKVLVIGTEKGDIVYVKVYKVINEAGETEVVKVEVNNTETKPPEAKPEDKPQTTTTPKTITTEIPTPTPTPAPVSNNIMLTESTRSGVSPIFVILLISTNYESSSIFKVLWNVSPTEPVYSADYYGKYFYLTGTTGSSYMKNNLTTAGTYHVRVCEHNGSSCIRYSNTINIVF